MESKDELKEIDIKNHACYYFDDIIKYIDINFSNIYFIRRKIIRTLYVYDISCRT